MKEEKMAFTISIAEEALKYGEMPISACVFLEDEVISKAYTTEKTEKRLLVHAELNALLAADKQQFGIQERKKMQLYTTLEPCLMCYGSAMSAYIGEIYYSLKAPDDGAMSLIKFEQFQSDYLKFQNPRVEGDILVSESKELFYRYLETLKEGDYMWDFTNSVVQCNEDFSIQMNT